MYIYIFIHLYHKKNWLCPWPLVDLEYISDRQSVEWICKQYQVPENSLDWGHEISLWVWPSLVVFFLSFLLPLLLFSPEHRGLTVSVRFFSCLQTPKEGGVSWYQWSFPYPQQLCGKQSERDSDTSGFVKALIWRKGYNSTVRGFGFGWAMGFPFIPAPRVLIEDLGRIHSLVCWEYWELSLVMQR